MANPTILIIEADEQQRQLYTAVFRGGGFTVLQAEDGEQGLQQAKDHLPDAVLLALALPKMHGFDVLQKIKSNAKTKDIPVVIFSLSGGEADMTKSEELGAALFLAKGRYSPKLVMEKVKEILASQTQDDAPTYMILPTEGKGDIAKLRQDMGMPKTGKCAKCKSKLAIKLMRYSDDASPLFSVQGWCGKCKK